MHTEDDARKLWCPMARVNTDQGNTYYDNRSDLVNGPTTLCIASVCAMWRWDKDFHVKTRLCSDAFATTEPARPADLPADWYFVPASISLISPAQWAEPTNQSLKRRTGYCGLGGKP